MDCDVDVDCDAAHLLANSPKASLSCCTVMVGAEAIVVTSFVRGAIAMDSGSRWLAAVSDDAFD